MMNYKRSLQHDIFLVRRELNGGVDEYIVCRNMINNILSKIMNSRSVNTIYPSRLVILNEHVFDRATGVRYQTYTNLLASLYYGVEIRNISKRFMKSEDSYHYFTDRVMGLLNQTHANIIYDNIFIEKDGYVFVIEQEDIHKFVKENKGISYFCSPNNLHKIVQLVKRFDKNNVDEYLSPEVQRIMDY